MPSSPPGPDPADPRITFTTALTRLRRTLPDLSDEVLARRASTVALPSGRRVAVNARRLGEWLHGRSVPRDFEQVLALVLAVGAIGGGTTAGAAPAVTVEQWRRLWRAAHEHRPGPEPRADAPPPPEPAPALVIGRPPTDAVSLRGRPTLADAVDAALRDGDVRQVLLVGPGGSGKSQLAAAAFHRARTGGGVFLWVPASSRQSVLSAYARAWRVIGGEVHDRPGHPGTAVTGGYGHDEETQADLLVAWLRSARRPWLVVLDDVDEPSDLEGLWPIGDGGRSIVTTRRRDARLIHPAARVVAVGMFHPDESVDYLRSRLAVDPADRQPPADADLAALADALGHFPLALGQAAAFLLDTGMSVPAYREYVDDQGERLADLFPPSSPADGYDRTVATTWQLAAQRAQALAKPGTVARMLEMVSLLAPEGVPESVLLTGAACRWAGGSPREALLALRALHRLGLVSHEASAVATHALVQRGVRESVPERQLPQAAQAAADALDEAWQAAGGRHVDAIYDSVEALRRVAGEHLWTDRMHPVLRRLAEHLIALGRDSAARDTAEDLLRQARSRLGERHRDVFFLRTQSARATGSLGDPASACAALSAIRHDAEQVLAADDPELLEVRLQEARQRSELGAASAALEDALVLRADAVAALGPQHPVTVGARRIVALCRGLSGDSAGARDDYAALAEDMTRRLGEQHPESLIALHDLGRWLGETGGPEPAVAAYLQAVRGLEAVFGRLHHDTLTARHNLAYWRGLAGQLPEAVAEFEVAAEDAERALGPRHPTTLTFHTNLAYWRGLATDPAQGMTELAALQPVVDAVMGAAHPRALRTRQQRAELRHRCGDTAGAVAELTAVLADMRAVQDEGHPRTREVVGLLEAWTGPVG